jgi:hypothetical protein
MKEQFTALNVPLPIRVSESIRQKTEPFLDAFLETLPREHTIGSVNPTAYVDWSI